MSDVTRILSQIDSGDPAAAEQLLPLVYDELRKLAAAKLAHEKPGQTLQATALVHEAYLRLVGSAGRQRSSEVGGQRSEVEGQGSEPSQPISDLRPPTSDPPTPSPQQLGPPRWDSRGHFFAAAAEAMRRILVENARRKASLKRGGQMRHLPLRDEVAEAATSAEELLALDEALDNLAEADPQAAELVKLRYFAGLSMEDAAACLGISPRNAYYTWSYARSWLHRAIAQPS
ncbi:MAG: ECF-type sigma factor [Planctomycetaceae bacterium]|nr:ECF-type sigma factor [Planctomycetaceae bacterium]